jgi:hypothetical protein
MAHKILEPIIRNKHNQIYRSNQVLIVLLIIGFIFLITYFLGYLCSVYIVMSNIPMSTPKFIKYIMTITGVGYCIIVIISVYVVRNDATKLNVGSANSKENIVQSITWKINTWTILVFFFWFVIFPLYFYQRKKLTEINNLCEITRARYNSYDNQ